MQLRKPVFKDSTEMCCLFFCLFLERAVIP
nr:MAG TPA: hypothetical protein [Caudoviricetes sp.]DAU55159.1 MAG TPA: hypothetical protein [Caudoviricetes sp.]